MRVNVYRLKAWKNKELIYELDYEFKNGEYLNMKNYLRALGYRVEERFAWS